MPGKKARNNSKKKSSRRNQRTELTVVNTCSPLDRLSDKLNQLLDTKEQQSSNLQLPVAELNQIISEYPEGFSVLYDYLVNYPPSSQVLDLLGLLKEHGLNLEMSSVLHRQLVAISCSERYFYYMKWLIVTCGFKDLTKFNPLNSSLEEKLLPESVTFALDYFNNCRYSTSAMRQLAILAGYQPSLGCIEHFLAVYGHSDLFKFYVQHNSVVNTVNEQGNTCLMYAIAYENFALSDYMIARPDIDLLHKNKQNMTALHIVVKQGNRRILCDMLDRINAQGHDLSQVTSEGGLTLLHWAISKGYTNCLDILFANTDLRVKCPSGYSFIEYALLEDEPEIALQISQYMGVEFAHIVDDNNDDLLSFCIKNSLDEPFKWLIENNYFSLETKRSHGYPLFLQVAMHGSSVICNYILQCRAFRDVLDLTARCKYGFNAGHYLVESNLIDEVCTLLETHSLDVRAKSDSGLTMLDIALHTDSRKMIIEIINYMLKIKNTRRDCGVCFKELINLPKLLVIFCDDNITLLPEYIEDGQPALHMACLYTDLEFAKELINNFSLDLQQKNQNQETVIACLLRQGKFTKLSAFLNIFEYNVKLINIDAKNSSLLHLACEEGAYEIVNWCLDNEKRKLSILKRRLDGLCALDIAIIRQNKVIVEVLWNNLEPSQQQTYIEKLQKHGNEDYILSYLLENDFYEFTVDAEDTELPPQKSHSCHADSVVELVEDSIELVREKSAEVVEVKPTYVDPTFENIVDAISKHNKAYLRNIKHQPELFHMFAGRELELLRIAINSKSHSVVYHMLRISPIKEVVNLDALQLACELDCLSIVQDLLLFADVVSSFKEDSDSTLNIAKQHAKPEVSQYLRSYLDIENSHVLIDEQVITLNPEAKEWFDLPKCFLRNIKLHKCLMQCSEFFKELGIEGYLYGSAHYKLCPQDLDVLIPNTVDITSIYPLIRLFESKGAIVSKQINGEYGYYTEGRNVIPMTFMGVDIELVVSYKSLLEHMLNLDTTVGARCLDMRSLRFVEIPGIDSAQHISSREIHTIGDACTSYLADPRRIFRAIYLITNESFKFSSEAETAIYNIFAGDGNPLKDNCIPGKIFNQIRVMYNSKHFADYLQTFENLHIFSKLYEFVASQENTTGAYYLDLLKPYHIKFMEKRLERDCRNSQMFHISPRRLSNVGYDMQLRITS